MKKATVIFDSRGSSGNIYYIVGKARDELRKQRRITDFNTMRDRVFESHSYVEALDIIKEYVDLIDISEQP